MQINWPTALVLVAFSLVVGFLAYKGVSPSAIGAAGVAGIAVASQAERLVTKKDGAS